MSYSSDPNKLFSQADTARIDQAIAECEKYTSAEIKVSIVRHCWDDIRVKAAKVFKKLGLDKTEKRNCVMIMLVLANREFLIYGDSGIHQHVGQAFWNDVRDAMTEDFRNGNFTEGIIKGIMMSVDKLALHFPAEDNDKNEISNEIEYEE